MSDYDGEPVDFSPQQSSGPGCTPWLIGAGILLAIAIIVVNSSTVPNTPAKTLNPLQVTQTAEVQATLFASTALVLQISNNMAQATSAAAQVELENLHSTQTAEVEQTKQAQIAGTQSVMHAAETASANAAATENAVKMFILQETLTAGKAIGTATAQASDAEKTATVAAQIAGTSTAGAQTQTVADVQNALLLEAARTDADKMRLDRERAQASNGLRTFAPWVAFMVAIPFFLYVGWLLARTNANQGKAIRNADGNVVGVIDQPIGGQTGYLQPGRMVGPGASFGKDGVQTTPVDPGLQFQVTRMDQLTQALQSPGASGRLVTEAIKLPELQPPAPTQQAPLIRVINPAQDEAVEAWVTEVTEKYLTSGGEA